MRKQLITVVFILWCSAGISLAQVSQVNTQKFDRKSGVTATYSKNVLKITWPAGNNNYGQVDLNMEKGKPLFSRLLIGEAKKAKLVSTDLDPAFLLTIGKRDLISQNGWNIFFDKVPQKKYKTYNVELEKSAAAVKTIGSRTVVTISSLKADHFSGNLEITFYNGSPLFNIAAVMATKIDSTAIVYDAGLINRSASWKNISWINT